MNGRRKVNYWHGTAFKIQMVEMEKNAPVILRVQNFVHDIWPLNPLVLKLSIFHPWLGRISNQGITVLYWGTKLPNHLSAD